jgi:hypothetical protein
MPSATAVRLRHLDSPATEGLDQVMPLAQGAEVATIGATAAVPGKCMVDLTPACPGVAAREATRAISGYQELTQ